MLIYYLKELNYNITISVTTKSFNLKEEIQPSRDSETVLQTFTTSICQQ